MKKNGIKVLSLIVIAVLVISLVSLVACNKDKTVFDKLQGESDRVILFIGDGMGVNHVKTGEAYYERGLFDGFTNRGLVETSCLETFQPTDSAAAASAMATGEKYKRGAIAFKDGQNYQSVSEYAKSLGKGVGIVTTDTLSGATPAGFSAHAKARSNKEDIIECQLNSNIDIFLGAGLTTWDGDSVNYDMYRSRFEEKGYTFCDEYSELSLESNKIIGSFSAIANYNHTEQTPTLSKLAEFAVDFLESKYPNGYFLMVEGAHIDKMSSDRNMSAMLEYLDEFDHAVEAVSAKISTKDNYSMIITADHECGDLRYDGESKDEIDDSMFKATHHTKADVYYYTKWKLKNAADIDMPEKIDNTDIFRMCYNLIDNK